MKVCNLRHARLTLAILASACSTDPNENGQPMPPAAGAPGAVPPVGGMGATMMGVTGAAGMTAPPAGVAGNTMATMMPAGSTAMPEAGANAMGGSGAMAGNDGTAGDQGMAGSEAMAGSDAPAAAGLLPRVETTDGPGPFAEVVKVKNTPPGGWMIYPKDIGRDGIKHPLFVFGPGGGTTPDTYESMGMHWDRYGSYGFVIYVLPASTGDGADMKAGLDWLIAQNDDAQSPLYQHLDTTRICAAGHSMGSVTTFDFMPDDRVTTTIHISGGSFDHQGPLNLSKDTMFLCGPSQSADTAVPQCDGDFMTSKVPTFYTQIQGSTHLTSGRLGWEAVIAWMLWHLADQEDQWKKEFIEPTGKFQMGIYKSQVKNW